MHKQNHLVLNLQREIDSAFSELIHERWRSVQEAQWIPAVDVYEREDSYLLLADLPGVAPSGVSLTVIGNKVVLCGSRTADLTASHGRQLTIERVSGRFCRTFHLANAIDTTRIEEKWESGVFRAILPKKMVPDGIGPSNPTT